MRHERSSHCCPGCGSRLRAMSGYPWYFCNGCVARATDGDGRLLEFSTVGISSVRWRYADQEDWHDHRSALCLIDKRPVYVTEARFGGVVAQPLMDGCATIKGPFVDDLRIKRKTDYAVDQPPPNGPRLAKF